MASVFCPAGATVEISSDGTTWTDVSDLVTRFDPQAHDAPVNVYHTFTKTYLCNGVADPPDVELEGPYTEGDTEPYAVLRGARYSGDPISVRVTPKDGTKTWTVTDGFVSSWDDPEVAADGTEILGWAATLTVDMVEWGAIAP